MRLKQGDSVKNKHGQQSFFDEVENDARGHLICKSSQMHRKSVSIIQQSVRVSQWLVNF